METMAGLECGIPPFPDLHFTVNNDELQHGYSHASFGSMYDSPPVNRKPKLQKQTSLDETNKKKVHNLHSPPMRRKSSTPPIAENELHIPDLVKLELNADDDDENSVDEYKKKRVRRVSFADAVGKELTQVQIIEQPEEVAPVDIRPVLPVLKQLELVLPLPEVDSETFNERFEKNSMILERLKLGTGNVCGRIRVKSVPDGEQRRVAVRYTTDGWMSFTKQPARLLPKVISESEHNSGETDLYSFDIDVGLNSPAIQFLISSCDSQGKAEFEDSNGGETYTVLNPNFLPPPEEDEEEEWEAWMRGDDEWCNDYY